MKLNLDYSDYESLLTAPAVCWRPWSGWGSGEWSATESVQRSALDGWAGRTGQRRTPTPGHQRNSSTYMTYPANTH